MSKTDEQIKKLEQQLQNVQSELETLKKIREKEKKKTQKLFEVSTETIGEIFVDAFAKLRARAQKIITSAQFDIRYSGDFKYNAIYLGGVKEDGCDWEIVEDHSAPCYCYILRLREKK